MKSLSSPGFSASTILVSSIAKWFVLRHMEFCVVSFKCYELNHLLN